MMRLKSEWRLQGGLRHGAVAALESILGDERGLHRMQPPILREPLDGGDSVTLVHDRQCEAAIDPPSLHDHGAGAALAVVASLLGACEPKMLP